MLCIALYKLKLLVFFILWLTHVHKISFQPNKQKNNHIKLKYRFWFRFSAIFNNISVILWRSVLLVEETGVPGENQRSVASHWQTLSHNVVSSTPCLNGVRTHNISGDRKTTIRSRSWIKIKIKYKNNYHRYFLYILSINLHIKYLLSNSVIPYIYNVLPWLHDKIAWLIFFGKQKLKLQPTIRDSVSQVLIIFYPYL